MPPRVAIAFVLFALLFGIGQFHRVSTTVIAPALQADLGLSGNLLGLFAASLFLGGAAAQIPIGILLDRYGPRLVVAGVALAAVAGAAVFATAGGAGQAIVGRTLSGIGISASVMGAYIVFARWLPADRFATVAAAMVALGSIGGLSATTPLALLLAVSGWRPVFLGLAALTALLAVLVWLLVRDAPPGWQGRPRRDGLAESLRGLGQVLRDRQFRFLLVAASVQFAPMTALMGLWAGPYLGDVHGLSPVARGNVLLAMAVAAPLAVLATGPLDRLLNTRKWLVLAIMAALTLDLLAMAALVDHSVAVAAVGLVVAVCASTAYVVLAAHCRAVVPDHLLGRANTLMNLIAALGIAFAQFATGLIVDALPGAGGAIGSTEAYRWVLLALAAFVAAAGIGYSGVRDAPPRPG